MLRLLTLFCWFAVYLHSATSSPVKLREVTRDAPFTIPVELLASSVECVTSGSIGAADGGIVLLVHGTGSTGPETWQTTPFVSLLPKLSPGFDICWITLPGRSRIDIQVSSEFVAYNIAPLAARSKTGKISIIAHSQGNLNVQWALNFWPSTRIFVQRFVSLSGDFFGTDEGPLACDVTSLLSSGSGCSPAVFQQSTFRSSGGNSSAFLNALHVFGGEALVKTTSIYTQYDEVVQSEQEPHPTSELPGAENIMLQAPNICGPLHEVDHVFILGDRAAFALTYDALTHDDLQSEVRFEKQYCVFLEGEEAALAQLYNPSNIIPIWQAGFNDAISVFAEPTRREPALKSYVCQSGSAQLCG